MHDNDLRIGNIRAFAGLCAGAFTAYLNSSYAKLRDLRGGRVFLQSFDVFSWIMAVFLLHLQVILLCKHVLVMDNGIVGSILILAAALAFAAIVMTVREINQARPGKRMRILG